jgi:hypothetical protein
MLAETELASDERAYSLAKPDTNVAGHCADYGCRLSSINRL